MSGSRPIAGRFACTCERRRRATLSGGASRHWPPERTAMCYHAGANVAQMRRGVQMITIPELVAQALGSFLASGTTVSYTHLTLPTNREV